MAKGKPDPTWQQRVLEWQASGKAILVWCQENQIPYTTFLGWKQRFENSHQGPQSNARSPEAFIELKDQPPANSGICSGVILEYHGIKICLQAGFSPVVLKQCLAYLGGVSC